MWTLNPKLPKPKRTLKGILKRTLKGILKLKEGTLVYMDPLGTRAKGLKVT